MSDSSAASLLRAALYAKSKSLTIENSLGSGQDGIVLSTNRRTAIKSFSYFELYRRERDVYLRFQENGFVQADDFQIPRLIEADDNLLIVEMTIVSPPYIVDFAGAYLDVPPSYRDEPEFMEDWLREKREEFEADWPRVKRALWKFEAIGIYLSDVAPRNIRCR